MVAYRQPVLLDVNVFDKDAAVGGAVGATVGAVVVPMLHVPAMVPLASYPLSTPNSFRPKYRMAQAVQLPFPLSGPRVAFKPAEQLTPATYDPQPYFLYPLCVPTPPSCMKTADDSHPAVDELCSTT